MIPLSFVFPMILVIAWMKVLHSSSICIGYYWKREAGTSIHYAKKVNGLDPSGAYRKFKRMHCLLLRLNTISTYTKVTCMLPTPSLIPQRVPSISDGVTSLFASAKPSKRCITCNSRSITLPTSVVSPIRGRVLATKLA